MQHYFLTLVKFFRRGRRFIPFSFGRSKSLVIYFDTAYLLKCYINEKGSQEIRTLAGRHAQIACCEYGRIELYAAFHRALEEGFIDTAYFETIIEQFEQDDQDGIWTWLPFDREITENLMSAFKALPRDMYLRTGDAIHLCCAAFNKITHLYTNDAHMLKAADYFRVNASNVIGTDRTMS